MDLGIDGLGAGSMIGTGASAVVYRATQLDLGREVAVKILSATDPAFIRRFEREAKTLGRLSRSPGIVTVFDSGVTAAGQPYLLLELCDESLLDRLQNHGPLDPMEVCDVAAQVAAALAAAHAVGVVHRDLKPANVLTAGDRYLVTDFGISTVSGTTTGQTNSVGFTAGYVAPETVAGAVVDTPADIYGLGATMFHLLSGETAFVDGDPDDHLLALVHRITNEPLPDLRLRGIPDSVCETVEWAMEKDPNDRPTATQLQARLEAITGGMEPGPLEGDTRSRATVVRPSAVQRPAETSILSDTPNMGSTPVIERQELFVEPEPKLTGRVMAAAVVAFLVGLGGLGTFLIGRDGDSPGQQSNDVVAGPSTTTRAATQGTPVDIGTLPASLTELRSAFEPVEIVDVVGESQDDAIEALEAAGFEVNVVRRESTRPRGTVLSQDPVAEDQTKAPFGSTITIFVAVPEAPPATTEVANVTGEDVASATATLQADTLSVTDGGSELSLTVAEGLVIRTVPPAGSTVNEKTSVALIVSLGQPLVPNVGGKTRAAAEAELTAAGLPFETTTIPSLAATGEVLRTVPAAGAPMSAGKAVSIVVSGGEPCTLPALVGTEVGGVAAALQTAGCPDANVQMVSSDQPAGTVLTAVFVEPTVGGGVSVAVTAADDSVSCSFDLVGLREAVATRTIEAGECTVGTVTYQPSTEANAGRVISATVAGESVNLVVGVPSCDVPPVAGLTVIAARRALRSAGCDGPVALSPPDSSQQDIVESVAPGAGMTIDAEAPITLTIGTPPPAGCFVPDVTGMTVTAARAAIGPDCSVVRREQEVDPDDPRIGSIILQSVSGEVPIGTAVTVTVAVEGQPPTTPTTGTTTPTTPTTPTVPTTPSSVTLPTSVTIDITITLPTITVTLATSPSVTATTVEVLPPPE